MSSSRFSVRENGENSAVAASEMRRPAPFLTSSVEWHAHTGGSRSRLRHRSVQSIGQRFLWAAVKSYIVIRACLQLELLEFVQTPANSVSVLTNVTTLVNAPSAFCFLRQEH